MDSSFKIDEISTKFPCGISTSNRWQIDEEFEKFLKEFEKSTIKVNKDLLLEYEHQKQNILFPQ